MLERTYSRHIGEHSDALTRAALLDPCLKASGARMGRHVAHPEHEGDSVAILDARAINR